MFAMPAYYNGYKNNSYAIYVSPSLQNSRVWLPHNHSRCSSPTASRSAQNEDISKTGGSARGRAGLSPRLFHQVVPRCILPAARTWNMKKLAGDCKFAPRINKMTCWTTLIVISGEFLSSAYLSRAVKTAVAEESLLLYPRLACNKA